MQKDLEGNCEEIIHCNLYCKQPDFGEVKKKGKTSRKILDHLIMDENRIKPSEN